MDSSVVVDLPGLKAQLDAWRGSHRKRARIPDHFYKTAVSLLDRYSVSAICQQTRLRPASLRKHAAPTRVVLCAEAGFNSTLENSAAYLRKEPRRFAASALICLQPESKGIRRSYPCWITQAKVEIRMWWPS